MKKTLLAAATGALLVLSLQGCGGGGTPSKGDLSSVLEDQAGLEGDVADCVADELLDSDLSDDQLTAVADDDEGDLSADEKAEVAEVIGAAATKCLTP